MNGGYQRMCEEFVLKNGVRVVAEYIPHFPSVSVGLWKEYWNLGIGTAMFEELIAEARRRGVMLLELEFIEGNTRARALYEKMGFRIVGLRPDGIRLRDGTLCNEYLMQLRL